MPLAPGRPVALLLTMPSRLTLLVLATALLVTGCAKKGPATTAGGKEKSVGGGVIDEAAAPATAQWAVACNMSHLRRDMVSGVVRGGRVMRSRWHMQPAQNMGSTRHSLRTIWKQKPAPTSPPPP